MRWPARKWVRWLLAALATGFLAAIVLATWIVTTEAGLRRAVLFVESLDAVKIHVEGASGRLIGPLAVASIEIDHPRATIRITGFQADYEPLELLAGRISAEGVRISDAAIRLRPPSGPSRPPSFMPGWLSVVIDEAQVARLLIVAPNGTEVPFRDIRGSAKLSKSRIEFDGVRVSSTGWAVAGASGSLYARDPIALDVNTAWSLSDERRVAGIAHAAGDLDRLLVEAHLTGPGIGRVTAEIRNLTSELTWKGKAQIQKLDLTQWIANPPFGPLRAELAISGDRSHYAALGIVLANGLPEQGVKVDTRATYADRIVTIESIALETGPASFIHANGTMTVAEELSYDVSATWAGFRWPLTGNAVLTSPRGSLEARGWTEFDYRVSGDFQPAGGPPIAGNAAGRFTAGEIAVDESTWRVLGGRVSLRGRLGRGEAQDWSVSGRAADIDPSKLRKELPGRLAFDFRGEGSGFDENAPWSGSIAKLSGQFRGQRANGSGGVKHVRDQTEFQDVKLALGPARLEIDGVLGRAANLDARVVSDDLSAFLPELGGRVNATLLVRERTLAFGFTGHDLAYGSHRAVILSADAHIDRDGREHSWLRLRSNGITLGEFAVTDTRLSLDGLPKDHALTFRVGAGKDAVALRGRGAWIDDRYTLQLEEIAATGPRVVPWRLESDTRLEASREDVALDPLCLVYESRRICFEGRWKASGDWSVKAATESFPLEALSAKRLGAPRFHGMLVVDAEASARAGEAWIADLRAEIRDATLEYKAASGADRTVALGLARLALVSGSGLHRLDLRVSDAADLDLVVALEAERIAGVSIGDLPLSGSVKGRTRQLHLLPLLVETIDNASGEAALDFSVAGSVAAPALEGEARLRQGSLDFYLSNLRLRDLQATMRLKDTGLTLDATGKAGEGTLAIDGRIGWRDRRLNGELSLTGDRLLLANVPEARVFASPDLKFTLDDHRIDVKGEVVIPEARITPADTAGAVLVSSDEQILRPELSEAGDDPFEVTSEVRLSLGNKVAVKAYGLSATVKGAVRTRTAPREGTVASGELEVTEGKYNAYGRELEIERGRLLFTGGPVADPGVDLRATRELPGYKVGVIARGRLRRPQLSLFSEPSLPQAQIASMLIVGRSSIQGDPGAEASDLSTTEQGGAYLAGQLGEYVGLDDVGVTQDSADHTELVLGKYLSPRLYVSYGISLVDEINTLKLRYTINDRWVISAESGRESAGDVEYRIED